MAKKVNRSGSGRRTQVKRSVKQNEYVVYRDKRGRIRKPRRDLLLFAEVRSRKTRKLAGYLNKFKKGKPTAQRFAPKQRVILETPEIARFESIEIKSNLDFSIRSDRMIRDQVAEQTEFYDAVMDAVRRNNKVIVDMDMTTNTFGEISVLGSSPFEHVYHRDLFVTLITKRIMDGINSLQLRMSPLKVEKQYGKRVRRKGRKITRVAHIRVRLRA